MTLLKSSSPAVSVLMTAYNREQFIAEAIESVLSSTFQDFELIIIDDCSYDHTVEIAQKYLFDPRVRVYINQKNLGDYPNRNRAAELAQGKYLKYLDSDDLIYSHGLEVMVQSMEKFPNAALGLSRPPSPLCPYPIQVTPELAYQEHFLSGGLLIPGPSGCIIRTNAFRSQNGFSGKRFVGDTELWLRLAAQHPIVKLVDNLVWWRIHPAQEYRLGYKTESYPILNFELAMKALSEEACPLSNSDRIKAINRIKHGYTRMIWRLALLERRPNAAFRLCRKFELSSKDLIRGLIKW